MPPGNQRRCWTYDIDQEIDIALLRRFAAHNGPENTNISRAMFRGKSSDFSLSRPDRLEGTHNLQLL